MHNQGMRKYRSVAQMASVKISPGQHKRQKNKTKIKELQLQNYIVTI